MSEIFFTMRISHDCFCNGQRIHRKRATSLQIQSCHHAQAIEVETYVHHLSKLHSCQTLSAAGGLLEALFQIEHTIMKPLEKYQNWSCCCWWFWSAAVSMDMDYIIVIPFETYDRMIQCETVAREREREVQYDTVWSSCFQLDYIHVSMNQIATSNSSGTWTHLTGCFFPKLLDGASISGLGRYLSLECSVVFSFLVPKTSLPAKNMHHNVTWEWTSPRTLRLMHHMRLICALRVAWHLAHLGTSWHQISAGQGISEPRAPCFSAPPTPGRAMQSASVTGHGMARMAQEAVNRRK